MTLRLPKPKREAKPVHRKRVSMRRGQRPNRVRKTPRGKLGRLADKLFSLIVRAQGECRYHIAPRIDWSFGPPVRQMCHGPMQPAHIFSRRYRSIRWDEDNAIPLCAGAHLRYTFDPAGWEEFIVTEFGRALWDDLRKRALEKWNGDLASVVARLKERAAVLGIQA